VICFAPDKNQADVINHLTGEPMAETRNVLIEAARIARVTSILYSGRCRRAGCAHCAGWVWRGQKSQHLCCAGRECQVDPDLKALAQAMHAAGKPLGFICIARRCCQKF
jgi:enhancing lycopene biosynthesis protein 2